MFAFLDHIFTSSGLPRARVANDVVAGEVEAITESSSACPTWAQLLDNHHMKALLDWGSSDTDTHLLLSRLCAVVDHGHSCLW